MATPPVVPKQQWIVKRSGGGGIAGGHRTLLVKDSAIASDVADHVTAYVSGVARRIVGVLRKEITSDLTLQVNLNGDPLVTITIPADTPIDTPIEQTEFTGPTAIVDGDVFSWDIVESDEARDAGGIASFTLEWS